ncbi:MAG: (2Fe-2S) ferredoxin domain-containing protein [Clostridiales bacterium]|nr:(2Fe-2S) ferredoxin domain-containing protein [Clostridiales bacterium]
MKTLQELEAIRQRTLERISLRKEDKEEAVRVVIGMATCGIAAGARPVLNAFMEEIERRHLRNVTVAQTGCIGMCRLEPMVDVYTPDGQKVTYVLVNPEKVRMIVADHIVNGHPVTEYTIGAADKQD